MHVLQRINFRGDLFATAICFAGQGVIKLGSSVILTRILLPEAYGVITILMSILFVIEMLGDIGVTIFIVRDEHGEQPLYLNTAWSMRFARAVLNCAALFLLAPVIASKLYNAPELVIPLRVISLSFLIGGLESMSFPLSVRRKRVRYMMYSELLATLVANTLAIIYCSYSRDFWGILFSIMLHRVLMTYFSWRLYPESRPKFALDLPAARQILKFTKFTMPSSMLTLGLSQFDKIVFLRLFDLRQLGVYGLAGNMSAPMESLILKISSSVLYPRCAHNIRTDQSTAALKYYTENRSLFVSILTLPAIVAGAAGLIVALLYPARYAETGQLLQAVALRAMLLSLASPAEDLLVAAGEYQVILVGNIYRAMWLVAGSLAGYYLYGLLGFAFGAALSGLPPLTYYLWLQKRKGMLIPKYELYKVVYLAGVVTVSYLLSHAVLTLWPHIHLRS